MVNNEIEAIKKAMSALAYQIDRLEIEMDEYSFEDIQFIRKQLIDIYIDLGSTTKNNGKHDSGQKG